ncbi:hypothetical protein L1887_30195 [Cichorium endivia]|nr:hypothetical protein L1887_30195 [Cichorium endivia]
MVYRTCGKKGDHWTSRCPHKDLAPSPESFIDKPPDTVVHSGGTKGAYVPPSMKGGVERPTGSDMRRRNEETLSELLTSLKTLVNLICLSFSEVLDQGAVFMSPLIRRRGKHWHAYPTIQSLKGLFRFSFRLIISTEIETTINARFQIRSRITIGRE